MSPLRARRSVGVDQHVADLAGEAVRTAHDPATGDDASADAGPERDQHRVARSPGRADGPLGCDAARRVVVDGHRMPEARLEQRADGELVDPAEVRRSAQGPGARDEPGHTHAERVVWLQGAGQLDERVDQPDGVVRREAPLVLERRRRGLSVAAACACGLVALALGAALLEGRPWQFREPPPWRRVTLGESGISLELPELTAAELSGATGPADWYFGGVRSPLMVWISSTAWSRSSASPASGAEPEPEPVDTDEAILAAARDQIAGQAAPQGAQRKSLELRWLGERRVLREELSGDGFSSTRHALVAGQNLLWVDVARVTWLWPEVWPGAEERIVRSLRHEGP